MYKELLCKYWNLSEPSLFVFAMRYIFLVIHTNWYKISEYENKADLNINPSSTEHKLQQTTF